MATKRLIVNGDDFGLSAGINEGIAAAHEKGILASTSLMVRWPAAAAAYARTHPELSIGLHLDLGQAGMYRDERLIECETLCDPAVRRALEEHGVEVCSFNSIRS